VSATEQEIAKALVGTRSGEPGAAERLLPLVYDQLRELARHRLAHERRIWQTPRAVGAKAKQAAVQAPGASARRAAKQRCDMVRRTNEGIAPAASGPVGGPPRAPPHDDHAAPPVADAGELGSTELAP
jgi:hypothetical protein